MEVKLIFKSYFQLSIIRLVKLTLQPFYSIKFDKQKKLLICEYGNEADFLQSESNKGNAGH